MYFSPYEGKILSYMEHTQIIASFFRLKLKGDQGGFWDWFQSLVWPKVIQHTLNFFPLDL